MSNLIRSNNVSFVSSGKKVTESEQQNQKQENVVETQPMMTVDEHQQMIEKLQQKHFKQIEKAKDDAFKSGVNQATESASDAAYEKGFSDGKAEGISIGKTAQKDQVDSEQAALNDTLVKQEEAFSAILKDLDGQLLSEIEMFESIGVELVFEVLLKILGSKAVNRTLIEEVLAQCLHKCISTKVVKVRVSVSDYQLIIKKALDEHVTSLLEHVEVTPDVQILPGGCIVETGSGNLDARLENQLQTFKDYLIEVYTQSQKSEGDLA
jgi:flagellar assembly protein FliH